jgi:5,10-methylenetetrahydrofolate reductase
MMEWMMKFVPGVVIPSEIQERLYRANEVSKEKFQEENIEIFSELCREIKKTGAAGIHMMPVGFEWIAPPILERAGIKG